MRSLGEAFETAKPRPDPGAAAPDKKNYAEKLSRELARVLADHLRQAFPGILPNEDGTGQESRARTGKGFKKLDVNFSTLELGMALGISIKTVNYPDRSSGRFTKNYTRIDDELRAEAMDYHRRQPYAVMVGILFLPIESCDDGGVGTGQDVGMSSFCAAVKHFRHRDQRRDAEHLPELFERFFIAIYDIATDAPDVRFLDVNKTPPRARRPRNDETLDLATLVEEITVTYDERNEAGPFTTVT